MAAINNERTDINIARGVYDETTFSGNRYSSRREVTGVKHYASTAWKKLASCSCSWNCFRELLFRLAPIIDWLPKYNIKGDLLRDITGGVTVGIMHIPQGLAFGLLASLPPVTGLYTALVPVLIYMFMGTSRHLSVGSFAVISLMVAQVCEREVGSLPVDNDPAVNGSDVGMTTTLPPTSSGMWSPHDALKMEIAVSLSLLVGIIQVAMGAARLGFVATFLSDPLISGFTTGSAVLVVISQLKHILGLQVPQITGPLTSPKIAVYMVKNIASSNVGSIITGVLCLVVLIGLKHLNEKYKNKMKFPIPAELLVVVIGTAISYGGAINEKFDVSIVGTIPKGLPPLSVPSMSLITRIIPDAFVIAVVIFATNISLAKMFAKKRGYTVDPNQELIAYGAGNIGGSFFSCFPICNALARTVVQENLANTQLCSVLVMALILLVLLFIAPLFFHLPKPILAAVVIGNLVGLLRQFSRLRDLWKIHRPDAVVWFFTCFGVLLLGVDLGLVMGVACALFAVVLTLSRSGYSILGQVKETELYRDVKDYSMASEIPGVKVLRFESSLYFGNAERFRNFLVVATGLDPSTSPKRREVKYDRNDSEDAVVLLEQESTRDHNMNGDLKPLRNGIAHMENMVEVDEPAVEIHSVVLDCSSFTFIDSVGLHVLPSLIDEFGNAGVNIYLAGCSCKIREKLQFNPAKTVQRHLMFPSIHDAVIFAVRSRDHAIWSGNVEKETVL